MNILSNVHSYSTVAGETVSRGPVNRADLTAIIEILPVAVKQRQEDFVQFIEFK